ncbi:MAG: hypothetical protein RLZZ546_377 [Bacteroidota bacterium]|jgi:hypothetical protein
MSIKVLTEPSVSIEQSLLEELFSKSEEKGQVILHFLYHTPKSSIMNIRIWPTTYLFDVHSTHKSELLHVEHITLYPQWMPCLPGEKVYFTLIFSGLPKTCTMFDFVEECIGQDGGFEARNIARNNTDVYFLEMI